MNTGRRKGKVVLTGEVFENSSTVAQHTFEGYITIYNIQYTVQNES